MLLHPSPLSSKFMEPLMASISKESLDVIAPDTPGYGNSDSVLENETDLSPYVNWLNDFFNALSLDKPVLYGSATGAQIAIEYARAHPNRIAGVVLDNAAHFEPAEREDIMSEYFPKLHPEEDGTHLKKVWEMASAMSQWFPWYKQDEKHRIGPSLDAPATNAIAIEYLLAGSSYDRAYRAAFENEDARRVQDITCLVKVIRWEGSMLKAFSDRYDNYEWQKNLEMVHCRGTIEARQAAICKSILAILKL